MKTSRPLPLIMALGLLTVATASAKFIPAKDAPPFRRDQLPIDVETMADLSQHMTTLCATIPPGDPMLERDAAQFLALALALDPVNRLADDLSRAYQSHDNITTPTAKEVTIAKTHAWQTQAWLAEDDAGKDANILADCLGDVLAKIDPQHPSSANHAQEQGQWRGWVADFAAFLPEDVLNALARLQQGESPEMENSNENEEAEEAGDDDDDDDDKGATFRLTTATVQSPLWLQNNLTETSSLVLADVTLGAEIKDIDYVDPEGNVIKPQFHYALSSYSNSNYSTNNVLRSIRSATVPYFTEKFGPLPESGIVHFHFGKRHLYNTGLNRTNISAAATVLTHAAFSGDEPTGIVVGIVNEDGKLATPSNIWELIRYLSQAPPSRVILPRSTEKILPGLLTMDNLSFFMKHDVLLADNINDLVTLSRKSPDPQLSEALKQFAEIRAKAPSTIGPFVANPHVLKRLEAIYAAAPYHASAKFLIINGKGQRASTLSIEVLAHEIRRGLAPLNAISPSSSSDERLVTAAAVQAAHEAARVMLDPLERMVATGDRKLYAEAIDLANTARTLARAMKKTGRDDDYDEYFGDRFHDKSAIESTNTLRQGLPRINATIAEILGEDAENFKFRKRNDD